jgi:2-dehydro-3-deoxyphosphooctonate aldolase (KDO 8-P synthase)
MIKRLIAGPCQHESLEQSLVIAKHCKAICDRYGIEYYFKASFDKANRSSLSGKRGVGIQKTLLDFTSMKGKIPYLKILTDVHSTEDVNAIQYYESRVPFRHAVDVIQIPAFLCRQTDLILAACKTRKIVNIKKGQFLAPWDVKGILSKTKDAGAEEVWITERGTSFGYNNLVVDFNGIQWMLRNLDVPLVFDATHSTQKPGGNGESSGGNRDYTPGLMRAANAIGVENFFVEVHEDPPSAPSDGENMVYLKDLSGIIDSIMPKLQEYYSPWTRYNFWDE